MPSHELSQRKTLQHRFNQYRFWKAEEPQISFMNHDSLWDTSGGVLESGSALRLYRFSRLRICSWIYAVPRSRCLNPGRERSERLLVPDRIHRRTQSQQGG